MTVRVHPQVYDEVIAASQYYESQQAGLGKKFEENFYVTFQTLKENPTHFSFLEKPFRRIKVGKFPFLIVYTLDADVLLIWACMHEKRQPGYWLTRTEQ